MAGKLLPQSVTENDVAEIKRLYVSGMGYREIASRIGFSRQLVWKVVSGVHPKCRGGYRITRNPPSVRCPGCGGRYFVKDGACRLCAVRGVA